MKIFVIHELCNGCQVCIKKCNYDAITIQDKKATIGANCVFCNLCVDSCPQKAISLDTFQQTTSNNLGDIWIFIEKNTKGLIEESSLEIISKMKKIYQKKDKEIVGVVLAKELTKLELQMISEAGASALLQIPLEYDTYRTETFSFILHKACLLKKPYIFLFSATELGRDLAPRLATLLDTGLTADCTELSIDPSNDLLIQTRPAFSGDLMASIICPIHRPMMATIRPHSFKLELYENKEIMIDQVSLKEMNLPITDHQIDVTQKNRIKSQFPLLEDQKIIISVGRGIGNQEQVKLVEAFARSIGAGIGCSRPIVDLGWLPSELQVGMSGKSVSPKLYIALGISGSVQHLVGIQAADYIIAVNRDENAPIFKVAHLGIVGNINEVLPELKKRIIKDELG
jgi:electron transfer flavoprotein alpha subunit/NAD-dependent dihydropyrimidine dehydrogenase PreA subunit